MALLLMILIGLLPAINCNPVLSNPAFCGVEDREVIRANIPTTDPIPLDWIDPATGHRVVRLSLESGSNSLYFHQNAFTPEGDQLLIVTPFGLEVVDLRTFRLRKIVPRERFSMGGSTGVEMGKCSRRVFYQSHDQTEVLATNIDSGDTRVVATLPRHATFHCVNADETRIFGAVNLAKDSADSSNKRLMKLFTIDLRTRACEEFHQTENWLNHLQASPSDPELGLFCHEGLWHQVDRVWTIGFDSKKPQLVHRREQPFEIAGHEFFSRDGQWIWYDLQTPRATQFWLAGYNTVNGERLGYALERSEWSVHYNVSADGKLFAGDGGGPDSVANRTPMPQNKRLNPSGNGKWIYLFRPADEKTPGTISGESAKLSKLFSEKLVDLASHDYRLEPNVVFSPDGRWIVFRSNMHGQRHVYAVEVERKLVPTPVVLPNSRKPKLVLIGDSTVKNSSAEKEIEKTFWGWGEVLHEHFDTRQIEIENRAIGGRSSRSYLTDGSWERSRDRIGTGDIVLIQFGHNDGGDLFKGNRPRASIKGNHEKSQTDIVELTGKKEEVRSFGWYLRNYIAEIKSRGAVPVVISPVPRNRWKDEQVLKADADYALWSREAAEQAGAFFIDLNQIVAVSYEALGQGKVSEEFFTASDWTHTTKAGAQHSAALLAESIRGLKGCSLRKRMTSMGGK